MPETFIAPTHPFAKLRVELCRYSDSHEFLSWHMSENCADVETARVKAINHFMPAIESIKEATLAWDNKGHFWLRRVGNTIHVSVMASSNHDNIADLRARLEEEL